MRTVVLGTLLVATLATMAACGGSEKCGPTNCAGCCNAGRCVQDNNGCGAAGANCSLWIQCVSTQECRSGKCMDKLAPCGNCPGCCSGAQCLSGNDPGYCGRGGVLCSPCPSPSQCLAGVCSSGSCGPASCSTGCCYQGTCMKGDAVSLCGTSGLTCVDCGAKGQICDVASRQCAAAKCGGGPGACSGCCTPAGACVGGTSASACGKAGATCADCTKTSQICGTNQTCETPSTTCNYNDKNVCGGDNTKWCWQNACTSCSPGFYNCNGTMGCECDSKGCNGIACAGACSGGEC